VPGLFVFVVTFSLYLRTLAPAVGEADTFEFQVGVARLGIAHGSGYPLLMLVGRLFTLLPVGGTLAYRANLTSAFFGALAAVGVERLARRLGVSPLVGVLAGLAFGLSPTLWSRATAIEAYTLNAFFVAVILNLCLRLGGDLTLSRQVHSGPSAGSPSLMPTRAFGTFGGKGAIWMRTLARANYAVGKEAANARGARMR
jgi:hypothetical protein